MFIVDSVLAIILASVFIIGLSIGFGLSRIGIKTVRTNLSDIREDLISLNSKIEVIDKKVDEAKNSPLFPVEAQRNLAPAIIR